MMILIELETLIVNQIEQAQFIIIMALSKRSNINLRASYCPKAIKQWLLLSSLPLDSTPGPLLPFVGSLSTQNNSKCYV